MLRAIFSIIIILIQLTVFCQQQDIRSGCANELVKFSAYPKNSATLEPKAHFAMSGINYVPIQLHVLRQGNGTTSFEWEKFLESFENLNKTFGEIGVQFYLISDVNYVDNTAFYDLNTDFEEDALCQANDVSNAVNLYLPNSIIFSYGFNATGYAYYPSTIAASNRIFVTNAAMNNGVRTLVHEFGHYFNLYHTFQNNNSSDVNMRELVSRGSDANCATTGDLLCDTPADPYGRTGATFSGCDYTGNITDVKGVRFTPETKNIMSYYSEVCGNDFSSEQFLRMEEGYIFRSSPSNQYSLNFVDQGVAKPTNALASSSTAGISLTFNDNATNELGYLIERSTDAAGPFEPIGSVLPNVKSFLDQDLFSNTTFHYRVRALNGIEYSNLAQATTGTFYCQPTFQQNCVNFPVVLEQFSIAGTSLSNIDSGCSPDNYGKFDDMVANLEKGNSYTFTASATTTSNSPYYFQFLTIWIDFNQNGSFETNEIVYKSTPSSGMNPAVSSLISIPNSAATGMTMLRARTQYFAFGQVSDPCDELVIGETEDYVVNITSPVVNNQVEVTSISPLVVCRGSSINISYTATGADFTDNTTYVVQIDNKNGQFLDLPTQKNGAGSLVATIPTSFASGSGFNIRVVATNPQVTSSIAADKLTVNVVPTTPTLTIDNSSTAVCVGSSVNINAIGCTGTVNWSNGLTGNPISFAVNEPITLTASCTLNGCTGGTSLPMVITTKPLPNAPIVNIFGGNSTFCAGETVRFNATSCSGLVTWSNGLTGSSISFPATSSTSLSATCRVDGCESVASVAVGITVNEKPDAPFISINGSSSRICVGETVQLNATGCGGTVNWSNGSTGNTISFTAVSALSLSATCTENECESESSNTVSIEVIDKSSPPTISLSGSPSNAFCVGDIVVVNATSCANGSVVWSNGDTGNATTFATSASIVLTARCQNSCGESEPSNEIQLSVSSIPSPPVISVEGGSFNHCVGESVQLNATGCGGTVNWSNGSTGNTISFTAVSALLLSATCTENGCESESSNTVSIEVIDKSPPPIISLSGSPSNAFCVGDIVVVNATSCASGSVVWSNGDTGNATTFAASASIVLTARCQNSCGESEPSNEIQLSVSSIPSPPVISVEGGSFNHCVGESVQLNATGCGGTVNWSNGSSGNSTTVVVDKDISYSATCTVNNCQSVASNPISFKCAQAKSEIRSVTLDLKVILEGPYNATTQLMATKYNQQGLLPGQTPVSQFGTATPDGQPYNRSPWNYDGSENMTSYASTVVDWVLVSLKNELNTIIYQTAALLHADATVELVSTPPELDTARTYFVQIDHRNHLGVMSANMLPVANRQIKYDFTATDSYIKPSTPAFGQKLIGTKYAMFVGDIDKSSVSQHYDINFADVTKLRSNVGLFEQYLDADLNLDADVNFNDLIIWRANSGKFSSITY